MSRTALVDAPVGTAGGSRPPARPVPAVRRRSRGRLVLGLFAMLACAGIALVTITDPYAGATAAPYYQKPALLKSSGVQRYEIQGGYVLIDPKRDTFRTVVAVQAAPVVPTTAPGEKDASKDAGATSAAAAPVLTVTPVGVAQTYAARLVAGRGWAPSEFSCLVSLWNRESGWNTHAANPSGAYGIPQALPGSKMGAGWQNDYQVQIAWGLGYIAGSYGSPCGAWGHSNAYGWY